MNRKCSEKPENCSMHFCVANWKDIGMDTSKDTYTDPLTGVEYDAYCDSAKYLSRAGIALLSFYVSVY